MKQNFIFDLDGTLVDSLPGLTLAVDAALWPQGKRAFLVTNKPSKLAENILKALGLYAFFESIVMPDSPVPPFRGKEEMLCSLVVVGHGYGHERVSADFLNCRVVLDLGAISALFIENGGAAL